MKLQTHRFLYLLLLAIIISVQVDAQVTVGSNLTPLDGALLDLKQNDNINSNSTKGLLNARVYLIGLDKMDPCIKTEDLQAGDKESHIGLLVYNITDSLEVGLCPGLHVWDGIQWIRLPEPCYNPLDPELINSPNCYIVPPNGGVSEEIPVGKPYLVWEQRSDLGTFDDKAKVFVDLIWQDKKDLIEKVELSTGDKGGFSKFKVTTKAGSTEGNALVGIHIGPNGDATDPIYWSWHIWVTGFDPEATSYTHDNGEATYIFMDRNLGAVKMDAGAAPSEPYFEDAMGLLYQWGRKDPFTASTSFYNDPDIRELYDINNNVLTEQNEFDFSGASGNGIKHVEVAANTTSNLKKSIQNPTTYYYGEYKSSFPPFDWFTSDDTGAGGDNSLWTETGKKSMFDPCPAGWRVPAYSSASKSPWAKFESAGWDPAPNVTKAGTGGGYGIGLMLNAYASTSRTELGFYPYGFERIARQFYKPGSVGSQTGAVSGGLFTYSIEVSNPTGYYWTATPKAGESSAKAEVINYSPFQGPVVSATTASRSMGASVRCVKDQ